MQAAKLTVIPDVTLAFDPAEIWPDAESCPDWPIQSDVSRLHNPHFGRADAINRLQVLDRALNCGQPTFEPDPTERKMLINANFSRADGPGGMWSHMGFGNLMPRSRLDEERCRSIVEVTHVRGFLRKLDTRAQRQKEAEEQEKEYRLRSTVEGYLAKSDQYKAELDQLAEAEARHNQRKADETAAWRAAEVRQTQQHHLSLARQAAANLGIDPPPETIDVGS